MHLTDGRTDAYCKSAAAQLQHSNEIYFLCYGGCGSAPLCLQAKLPIEVAVTEWHPQSTPEKTRQIYYKILDKPGIMNDAGFSGYTSDLLLRKPLSPPATRCQYTIALVITGIRSQAVSYEVIEVAEEVCYSLLLLLLPTHLFKYHM